MSATFVRKERRVSRTARATKKTATPTTKSPANRKTPTAEKIATEPTRQEIAEREAVAQAFFNPSSARAARAAFLKRRQPKNGHAR